MQQEEISAAYPLAASERLIKVAQPGPLDDRTSVISNAELRKSLHESTLKRCQARHHRDYRIAYGLCKFAWRAQRRRHEMGGTNDALDDGAPFGAVAVQQLLAPAAAHCQIELPDQVPCVLQARIHSLPAKRAVDMRRVASQEDSAVAQTGHLAVMDAEKATPMYGARLDSVGGALRKQFLHAVQRWRFLFCALDRRHDASAPGAHWKNSQWAEFAGTELQLVGGKRFVCLDVCQHE